MMRDVLRTTLEDFLEHDDKVIVMDADLASANGTASLRHKYPTRALNVGISEANMASMAAGMSTYGYKPFIITFTAFATRRIADQLAISISYAKQNVKIIGTDSGVASETNGGTHMSFEDIGIVRSIPNTKIIEAIDEVHLKKVLEYAKDEKGAIYIRTVRKNAPAIFKEEDIVDVRKANVCKQGNDITIIASGVCVNEALLASKELSALGIQAEVLAVGMIKPIDTKTILESVQKTGLVLTVENHNIKGGLFSEVSELLAQTNPVYIKPLGIHDHFGEVGNMKFLMDKYGFDCAHIVKSVVELVKRKEETNLK